MSEPLLSLRKLSCHFRQGREYLAAVDDVSLDIHAGEVLALVGESGSGKSTLGRLIAGLETPSHGNMLFEGRRLDGRRSVKHQRGAIQMVFQDSYASLDPRMRIVDSLAEPLKRAGAKPAVLRAQVEQWLARVGLSARFADRYPHQLSGGQRQRIGIARALYHDPEVLVFDEATSALDYSSERQVGENLAEAFTNTTLFFITHRLTTVKNANTIIMMDRGSVVEQGTHDELMAVKGRYFCLYQQQESQQ